MPAFSLNQKKVTWNDVLYYLVMGMISLFVYAKGCSNNVPRETEFDFRKAARASNVVGYKVYWEADTTHPKPINQLYLRKIDTLDMVINQYLGHSMTVDNSEQVKAFFFRITRELRTDSTLKK